MNRLLKIYKGVNKKNIDLLYNSYRTRFDHNVPYFIKTAAIFM